MVANILPHTSSPWSKSTFSEHGHVAYQIKGNQQMQQHGSKYFARRPISDPRDGVNRAKLNFFQNMAMLHIKLKGIAKYCSMVANILPADLSLALLLGSKGQN